MAGFFGDEAYGKFPQDGEMETQIIMEWKYWLSYMSTYLNRRWSDNKDFMDYL